MADNKVYETLINARLTELAKRMQDVETELDHPKSKDLDEQAIDLEDDEVLERVGEAAQKESALLQLALRRIEDGSYGTCETCGGQISDARLRAVLYAMLCRNCAQAANPR